MKKQYRFVVALLALCIVLAPMTALADDWDDAQAAYFTVHGPDGDVLLRYAGPVAVDDEYISGDNRHYRIDSVDERTYTATAVYMGDATLADLSFLNDLPAASNKSGQNKLIALYCTHSSESYVPTDGTDSKPNDGGIYDVADALKSALEKRGATVVLDRTNHYPHDSGAYRRSRQTASKLASQAPVAMFDVHRDGVPAEEYAKEIDGEQAAKVRLLVGRANQNRWANQEFAKTVKAVADKQYPGLIKDIYIGKGNYNQELMPQALLLEFGTHENEKERAIKSTEFMADVISTALFGTSGSSSSSPAPGTTVKPGTSAAPGSTAAPGAQRQSAESPPSRNNSGAATGIFVVLGVLILGGAIFLILSRGEGGAGHKLRGFASEITGGALGNRRKKDRDDHDS